MSPPRIENVAEVRADPAGTARAAGLRYTSDRQPGYSRVGSGKRVRYFDPEGSPVRSRDTLKRIRALAIPPAWKDVWICLHANGHLQATGRDVRGRKQYRYHARWRQVRDEAKYDRLLTFARALPLIRAHAEADLAKPGLPRTKVLATVVQLLERTLIRVGNEEYAQSNGTYGLTTMRNRHVTVAGSRVRFAFRGKSGVRHRIDVRDARLARVVKRCQDLPGQELFQYVDEEGATRSVTSADVNDYLREVSGEELTAKDFRTWAGTVLAAAALRERARVDSEGEGRKVVGEVVEQVARQLGNTPAVCRRCYVHPAVVGAYLEGALPAIPSATEPVGLGRDEQALVALLATRQGP